MLLDCLYHDYKLQMVEYFILSVNQVQKCFIEIKNDQKLLIDQILNNFFYKQKYLGIYNNFFSKYCMQPEHKINSGQMKDQNYQQIIQKQGSTQIQKQLLRNIGCNDISKYITRVQMKKKLGYSQQCCQQLQSIHKQSQFTFQDMVGLDCQLMQTNIGPQLCRLIIIKMDKQILYNQWFDVQEGTHITDMQTHLTGIDQQKYQKNMKGKPAYSTSGLQAIHNIIKGKIIVGHDLANHIKLLGISHQIFIDTVALLPHPFGLPFKNKLKDLTFQYLKRHIQWDSHNPFEDSICALQITKKHIQQGRGTIEVQPAQQIDYTSPDNPSQIFFQRVIKDAELDINKILLFVLRGSRALDIQVQIEAYTSDWDYVVVYDIDSQLDGRLIKLPNIDISFFDKHSFQKHLLNNDISYFEIFFLPEKYKFINKIQFPYLQVDLIKLRGSLGFHVNKSIMKIKRFYKEIETKPEYKWKILKANHLQIRFMELCLQLNEVYREYQSNTQEVKKQMKIQQLKHKLKQSVDVKKMNNIWFQAYQQFKEKNNYEEIVLKLEKIQGQKMKQVNTVFQNTRGLRYKAQTVRVHKKDSNKEIQMMKQDSSVGKIKNKIELNPLHGTLETVKFLKNHPIQQLQTLKITCKRHKFYPNLIQLHYMPSADFSNPVPYECRGLILDTQNQFSVIALPYYKFHDYNDPRFSDLKKFDWESVKVYEKKDGSIAFMYYYSGKWNVASSTIPDGTNDYCFSQQQNTTQFSKQFWNIFYSLGFKLPNVEDQSKTFVFQLMSKNHIIVVKRTNSQLCLHGVRDISTLQQENHLVYAQKYNWIVNKPLQIPQQQLNIQSLVKRVEQLDPLKHEGYVVCDKNWTRMKIKSSNYVRINWLGEINLGYNKDPKRFILMQIVLTGEAEVFCKYCPEWQKVTKELLAKIKNLNERVIEVYEKIKDLPQRQFALAVKNEEKTFQSFVFAIKRYPDKYYGKAQLLLNPKTFYTYISSYK